MFHNVARERENAVSAERSGDHPISDRRPRATFSRPACGARSIQRADYLEAVSFAEESVKGRSRQQARRRRNASPPSASIASDAGSGTTGAKSTPLNDVLVAAAAICVTVPARVPL